MSDACSVPAAAALRVLWIESGQHNSESGLAWLHQRMQEFQFARRQVSLIDHAWPVGSERVSPRDRQWLMERINCGIERIVVACVNRFDYPEELIRFLQQTCPEVPLTVACDSWWDGRRRTGLTTPGHLSLPWYRWWDGWVDWLQGRSPALFEVAPAAWPVLSSPPPVAASSTCGLVVGNCHQTTAAWALVATTAGHGAECISWRSFQQQFPERWSQRPPQWVLWDDTCLDTIPVRTEPQAGNTRMAKLEKDISRLDGNGLGQGLRRPADADAMRRFFEHLCRSTQAPKHPSDLSQPRSEPHSSGDILGIVAVCMPRAAWAIQLCTAPSRELLVKPSAGQGLKRLLGQVAFASRATVYSHGAE